VQSQKSGLDKKERKDVQQRLGLFLDLPRRIRLLDSNLGPSGLTTTCLPKSLCQNSLMHASDVLDTHSLIKYKKIVKLSYTL